jgi:hypothetical protein
MRVKCQYCRTTRRLGSDLNRLFDQLLVTNVQSVKIANGINTSMPFLGYLVMAHENGHWRAFIAYANCVGIRQWTWAFG